MIIQVTEHNFIDSFSGSYADNFSYEGKIALYNYLEDLDEDCGTQTELDPVAICCEYSEYESLEDCLSEYSNISSREELEDNTTVIDCDNGHIIIQSF